MDLKNLIKPNNFQEILNNLPDGIIIINYQKNITFWNVKCQELLGYTRKEAIGKNIGFIFNIDIQEIYKVLNTDKSVVLSARTKTDKELFLEVTCCDTGSGSDVYLSVRNITDKHKVIEGILSDYEKTKTMTQNKSGFLANMSGELRTPMHSIIGFSQALLDGLGGQLTEKQEKYINIINKNANSLHELINSILDISRIEAGKTEINMKMFDVVQVINLATETVISLIDEKNLAFATDLTDLIKRNCYSDENTLRQIITNILNNAVKFTDTGSIRMKVSHPDLDFVRYQGISIPPEFTDKSYLMFSVADTGIGIAEGDLNKIFNEYRQIDRAISKKYGGSGLGLAITRKLLEEIGGIIWVESEVFQGSTFSFIIPIEKPEQKQQ
jgi:PAS domain S-box-containing protein